MYTGQGHINELQIESIMVSRRVIEKLLVKHFVLLPN